LKGAYRAPKKRNRVPAEREEGTLELWVEKMGKEREETENEQDGKLSKFP